MSGAIDCTGPGCYLCALFGPSTSVAVPVKDLSDGKVKMLTLKRKKAEELGLIKPETTVLDDLIEAVDRE